MEPVFLQSKVMQVNFLLSV